MHEFDKTYWEDHWAPHTAGPAGAAGVGGQLPVNPYLLVETEHLPAGTALDAGCGTGAEALWLAEHNWQVTGADISAAALAAATDRAANRGLSGRVKWVEADLTTWEPGRCWDLVVTSYAHSQTGQLAFYQRLGSWVAPGGTLLIVGHLHNSHNSRHGDHHGSSSGHPEHRHRHPVRDRRVVSEPGLADRRQLRHHPRRPGRRSNDAAARRDRPRHRQQ